MKIFKKIIINKPIEAVWNILAHDFDKAADWMAIVPKSHKSDGGTKIDGAPMGGRVCELSEKPNGLYADEFITGYDESNHKMTVLVVPKNTPAGFPITKNEVQIKANQLNESQTEVTWESSPSLKAHGVLLSPLLKFGLGKSFNEVLEELKHFVETGEPHPRKLKKLMAS